MLFRKLRELGFAGRVYDLLLDMYTNDVLFIQINGELTRAMYLTQGLKQGCNLSPLFFNIMMIAVVEAVEASNLGCVLGGRKVPMIVFADDVGLMSTSRLGLEKLLQIVCTAGAEFNMKLSAKKSKVMQLSRTRVPLVVVKPMPLETVLSFRYLGVWLEARPYAVYYQVFADEVLAKAKRYLNVIRMKARSFPDPAFAARHLWMSMAIPAILYCTGVTGLSSDTWSKLEAVHCQLGKFILQVPYNTQNVSAYVAAGLEPLRAIFMRRIHGMLNRLVSSRSELVQLAVAVAEVQGNKSQLFRDYGKVFGGADEDFDLKEVVKQEIILVVNAELRDVLKTTSFFFPFLGEGSLRYPWNSMSQELSKVMYEFLFCNAGLGNRAPVPNVPRVYECVSCSMIGLNGRRMNESHLLLDCPRKDK